MTNEADETPKGTDTAGRLDGLVGPVCKTLLDCTILLCVGFPAAAVSYLWQHVQAGWAFGEWFFDKEAFMRRYGRKPVTVTVKFK